MTTLTISADLIRKTYGTQLIGTLVATFLSGMNTLQTVVYFRIYHDDIIKLKALVAVIWGLDIIHTAFLWSNLWLSLIIKFGQVSDIDAVPKPYIVPGAVIVTTTMISIVHMFYVQRIFRFSRRNYWITTPVVILVIGEVACTVGGVVILYGYEDFSQFIDRGYKWTFSLGSITAAVSDIAIMTDNSTESLNSVIDQLILYTFETGSLTAFMAIAIMITWLTQQRTAEIYLGLHMAFPKVYVTTLLGLLNTRHHLRRDQGLQSGQGRNPAIRFANPASHSESTNPTVSMQFAEAPTGIQHQHIHVNVSKNVWIDDETK